MAAIVYLFQQGFEGGKRDTWIDNETNSRKFRIEGRFASAGKDFRTVVENDGTP